jgi:hypothetical protein
VTFQTARIARRALADVVHPIDHSRFPDHPI